MQRCNGKFASNVIQKTRKWCMVMSQISHSRKKINGTTVYPEAAQVIFADTHMMPDGQAHVSILQ